MERDPAEVTVKDIFDAVGEEISLTPCTTDDGSRTPCSHENQCLAHDMWVETANHINDYFAGITIKDILEKQSAAVGIADSLN